MHRYPAPKPPPNPNFAQQPMSSILKAGLPPVQPRPPLKYATAAAAAVTPSASQQSNASAASSAPTQVAPVPVPAPASAPPLSKLEPGTSTTLQDHIAAVTSSPSLTQISTSSPFLSSTSASAQQPDGSFDSPLLSEAESHPEPPASAAATSPLVTGESYHPTTLVLFLSASGMRAENQDVQVCVNNRKRYPHRYVVCTCWTTGQLLIVLTVCSATICRRAGSQRVAGLRAHSDVDRIDNHFSAGDHAFAYTVAAATTATAGTWLVALTAYRADTTTTTSVPTRRQARYAASPVRVATAANASTPTSTTTAAADGTTQWGTELIVGSRGSLREREAER